MTADGASRLLDALDDGLALAHEFDGASITVRLAHVGLDAEDVRVALEARWEIYSADEPEKDPADFVRGWTEGLLAGVKVGAA